MSTELQCLASLCVLWIGDVDLFVSSKHLNHFFSFLTILTVFSLKYHRAFYPFIMRQMQVYQTLCVNVDVVRQVYNYDQATAVLQLLTTVLDITLNKWESEKSTTALIEWEQIDGLLDVIEIYVKKWLWELEKSDEVTVINKVVVITNGIPNFPEKF